jgi:hypothetical protein
MSAGRRSALPAVALLLGGLLGTPGCAVSCPAIAYLNTVTLDTSAFPEASSVQFCVETECTPAPGEPENSGSLLSAEPGEDGHWSLMLDMRAPEEILIRVLDARGAIIHESEEPISWTFTEGSCPGPATAEPVVLG